jgi:hypothetical protein
MPGRYRPGVSVPLNVVKGRAPIVLVAPHGGRRDSERRPWGSAPLKMNDLHTAALAVDLAARLDASALVNPSVDRNDVDLNRVTAAHDGAPAFLDALGDLVAEGLAAHPRLSVLTVHGWNVVQPAVDIGLGAHPEPDTLAGGGPCAIAPAFATTTLPRFAAALAARGIVATPGLRYPARARENLLQLFTRRYCADERAAVRRLAGFAERVDALQLELSLPLRLPGPWRDAFVDACAEAFASDVTADPCAWPPWLDDAAPPEPIALEFIAPGLAGLAAIDPHGGRLLLFPDDGRLVHFTGERVGRHAPDRVGPLRMTTDDVGTVTVEFDGPMLAFPDTTPFVDLERGLATATAVGVHVRLELSPSHTDGDPCPFGVVRGRVRVGDVGYDVTGHGIRTRREVVLAPRRRAGVRLADGTVLIVRGDDGIVCRAGAHRTVRRCALRLDGRAARLEVDAEDGMHIAADLRILHWLPVVPGAPGAEPIAFLACMDGDRPAGWLTVRAGDGR